MKHYNIQNYIRYKEDIKSNMSMIPDLAWEEYTRDQLIIKFMPLVENLARKFATSQQASGVMSINDIIQEGNAGLILAVEKVDWSLMAESTDQEKTLKSFFAKRIKGAMRRAIDINRGNMRIPEHKLNEMRKEFGADKKMVAMFFNSIFQSIDGMQSEENNSIYEIADEPVEYNNHMLNAYLLSLMKTNLNWREFEVLRLSYGLDCDKHTANEIASKIDIKGSSSYVRVSQLKRQAIDKLIESVDHSQVIDFV